MAMWIDVMQGQEQDFSPRPRASAAAKSAQLAPGGKVVYRHTGAIDALPRVEIAYEDYPAVIDGQLQIGRRLVDTDPFLFGSEVHGSLEHAA